MVTWHKACVGGCLTRALKPVGRPELAYHDRSGKPNPRNRVQQGAVLFLFFSYLTWQVVNPYRNQPYEQVPHGDHVHYVPKDWNEDVPISRFPRQPPEEGERITPDGKVVPAGPDAASGR